MNSRYLANIPKIPRICYICDAMRYRIDMCYSGDGFCGWQIQPDAPSIQGTLEQALSTLLRETVPVTGAGRTDTGVNASRYVAHFDFASEIDTDRLVHSLNAILPQGIAVFGIRPVSDDFHARFGAVRREYSYFIHRKKNPFLAGRSYYYAYPDLDFDAMNRAASLLVGTRDFSCFEKKGADNKTSVCTIFEAGWHPVAGIPGMNDACWCFRIAGDRFLRNMVRAIVGTLLEVGRGRRGMDDFSAMLDGGTRSDAGESVPGYALFLSRIDYQE